MRQWFCLRNVDINICTIVRFYEDSKERKELSCFEFIKERIHTNVLFLKCCGQHFAIYDVVCCSLFTFPLLFFTNEIVYSVSITHLANIPLPLADSNTL